MNHLDGGSSTDNQINTPGGVPYTIRPGEAALFSWDPKLANGGRTWSVLGVFDPAALHSDVAAEITASAAKAAAVGADTLVAEDSADSDNKKSLTVSGLMDSILTSAGSVLVDGSGNVLTA